MDFVQAYKTIVKRSVQRNIIEIPAFLSSLDFENLECLEIGAGPEARIAIEISGFVKHVTCLEKDRDNIAEIKRELRRVGLGKKISVVHYSGFEKERFPFPDKSFDVVYCAWLPHKTVTNPKFLDEITRVSRRHILILMPGIKGDEPLLVSIVRPKERKRRIGYKKFISDYLRRAGYRANYKEGILRLEFANRQEIRETFYCLAFKNEPLGKKKKEVDSFLDARVKTFADGFYIIHGEKK